MTRSLEGLRVFVTGGSRGIGAATVLRCAAAGADVYFSYTMQEQRAREVAAEARHFGVEAEPFQMEVLDEAAVMEVFAQMGESSSLDGLVNNVGYMGKRRFEDIDSAEWKRMLDVNLTGTFNCTRAALPLLARSSSAAIINITSRLGQVGSSGFAHYAAAKAGLIGFTRSLAFELADRRIRVNAVAPGVVETPDQREWGEEERREKLAAIPLGAFSTPDEIAAVIEFLLSQDSASLTGQTLNPSGGAYMP